MQYPLATPFVPLTIGGCRRGSLAGSVFLFAAKQKANTKGNNVVAVRAVPSDASQTQGIKKSLVSIPNPQKCAIVDKVFGAEFWA